MTRGGSRDTRLGHKGAHRPCRGPGPASGSVFIRSLIRRAGRVDMRVPVPRSVVLGLAEARPVVQVIFMLRFTAGAVLADPERTTVRPQFWAGAAAWYCATVAIYLYNGVTDVVEDRANHSRRPIAGGRLSVAAARRQVAGWALAA